MTYLVKEIFYTLQGEGTHAGRPAVFCRFTSCNLWTGREKDRARAICQFCDTDFVGTDGPGGGRFATADDLADAVAAAWPARHAPSDRSSSAPAANPAATGRAAVEALHARGLRGRRRDQRHPACRRRASTGSASAPRPAPTRRSTSGDELKLVYPQDGGDPGAFEDLRLRPLPLQPMDGPDREENTRLAVEYCLAHPQWRLSLQTHKYLGIP